MQERRGQLLLPPSSPPPKQGLLASSLLCFRKYPSHFSFTRGKSPPLVFPPRERLGFPKSGKPRREHQHTQGPGTSSAYRGAPFGPCGRGHFRRRREACHRARH